MTENYPKIFNESVNPTEGTGESEKDGLRIKRREKVIDGTLEKLIVAVQKYKIQIDALCLETEELKSTRESLSSDLQQVLQQSMEKITPKLIQEVKTSMHHQVTDSLKANIELLQRTKNETERVISTINTLADQNRNRFLKWGLSLVVTVCFSCFVMASGLFYFFPQQQFVRYEMTVEQAKQIVCGKALWDNFKKLTHEDQKLLANAFEESIKQLENEQAVIIK